MSKSRNRLLYLILTLITMILGLLSRRYGNYLPNVISEYSGDTLWALMVYFGFAFLFNNKSIVMISVITLIFSYSIEISQVYQGHWINNIRGTTIGALILGKGFLFSDLICYSFGTLIGSSLDKLINKSYKL